MTTINYGKDVPGASQAPTTTTTSLPSATITPTLQDLTVLFNFSHNLLTQHASALAQIRILEQEKASRGSVDKLLIANQSQIIAHLERLERAHFLEDDDSPPEEGILSYLCDETANLFHKLDDIEKIIKCSVKDLAGQVKEEFDEIYGRVYELKNKVNRNEKMEIFQDSNSRIENIKDSLERIENVVGSLPKLDHAKLSEILEHLKRIGNALLDSFDGEGPPEGMLGYLADEVNNLIEQSDGFEKILKGIACKVNKFDNHGEERMTLQMLLGENHKILETQLKKESRFISVQLEDIQQDFRQKFKDANAEMIKRLEVLEGRIESLGPLHHHEVHEPVVKLQGQTTDVTHELNPKVSDSSYTETLDIPHHSMDTCQLNSPPPSPTESISEPETEQWDILDKSELLDRSGAGTSWATNTPQNSAILTPLHPKNFPTTRTQSSSLEEDSYWLLRHGLEIRIPTMPRDVGSKSTGGAHHRAVPDSGLKNDESSSQSTGLFNTPPVMVQSKGNKPAHSHTSSTFCFPGGKDLLPTGTPRSQTYNSTNSTMATPNQTFNFSSFPPLITPHRPAPADSMPFNKVQNYTACRKGAASKPSLTEWHLKSPSPTPFRKSIASISSHAPTKQTPLIIQQNMKGHEGKPQPRIDLNDPNLFMAGEIFEAQPAHRIFNLPPPRPEIPTASIAKDHSTSTNPLVPKPDYMDSARHYARFHTPTSINPVITNTSTSTSTSTSTNTKPETFNNHTQTHEQR